MAPQGTTISVNHLIAMHNGETLNVKSIAYSGDTKQNSRQNKNKEDNPNKEDEPNEEDDSNKEVYPNEEEVPKEKDNSILKKCHNKKKHKK